jgi:hypothetical protein
MANTNWHRCAIGNNEPPTLSATATDELPEPKRQKLFMSESDLARVKSGELIASIRFKHRPDIVDGPLRFDSGLSSIDVEVYSVRHCILAALTEEDLACAGYDSMYDFRSQWSKYSNDLAFSKQVTVIYFRVKA